MIVIKGVCALRTLAVVSSLTSCAWAQPASDLSMTRDESQIDAKRELSPATALVLANRLLAEGKSEEALTEFERLADTWEQQPELRHAADLARFNQACVLAAMDQAESAARLLRRLSQETEDLNLRGNARHNLGLAEAALSEAAMKEDLLKAIDLMRRAERDFRNAASDQRRTRGQADDDTIKNIEVAQRKAAKMEAEQRQREEEQQQQEKQEKQEKQEQQDKQKQKPEQKDTQKPEQEQGQQKQNSEEQQKQQDQQGQQEPKPSEESSQNSKEQEASEGQLKPKEDANPQKEALSEEQQQELKNDQKSYDLTAMQILEKERQNRALIRQLLKRMRGKLAPVEKDW